jgi:single-strand DNA-binding protein
MKDVNVVALSGRLGRDPELRDTNGTKVCNFSIATNESYKNKDGTWEERASWFDITVWGAQGENCAKYLSKGSQVMVQGHLKQSKWEDKDGQTRSKVQVTAEVVLFPPAGDGARTNRPAASGARRSPMDGLDFGDIDEDDGIPF